MNLSFQNIKKKLINAIEWRLRNFNKKYIFSFHEFLVSLFFGKIKSDYLNFKIDSTDISNLSAVIQKSKRINFSNYLNINNDISKNIFLKKTWIYNKNDKDVYDGFDKTQHWYDINMTPFLENFIKKLFPIFKKYLGSNFSIVNLRAWKNLPNSRIVMGKHKNDGSAQERGPCKLHADGFPPGHIKCMIYLQPLNKEFGLFELDGKEINFDEPGNCIIFKNSEIMHRAIPGTKFDRFVIELTFMRTLFKVNELKYVQGKPDATHLSAPYFAYF
jgi:hypothetical protein